MYHIIYAVRSYDDKTSVSIVVYVNINRKPDTFAVSLILVAVKPKKLVSLCALAAIIGGGKMGRCMLESEAWH